MAAFMQKDLKAKEQGQARDSPGKEGWRTERRAAGGGSGWDTVEDVLGTHGD